MNRGTARSRPVRLPLSLVTMCGRGLPPQLILTVRLFASRNLYRMSIRWRIGLAAVIAAAVVGGFVPHTVLSAADASTTQVAQAVEAPLTGSMSCADATCGKGNTAPAAPSSGIALVAVVAGVVAVAAAAACVRRRRGQPLALPVGSRDPLYHPPQFS